MEFVPSHSTIRVSGLVLDEDFFTFLGDQAASDTETGPFLSMLHETFLLRTCG